jgi:hypothetical protein
MSNRRKNMSAKKKKEITQTTTNVQEVANVEGTKPDVDTVPQPEIPEKQVEIVSQVETSVEPKPEPVSTTIEPAKSKSVTEPAKVESATTKVQPAITVEVPTPRPLTLEILQAEINELRDIISQLQATPVQQRKPVSNGNGKIAILDKTTGKVYPSKNNVYQSLLKAGELKDLVEKGVFGSGDPAKNSFGCYSLFRAFPDRFIEVKNAATENPPA